MERAVLGLDTIGDVDGGAVRVAFDRELQKVMHDLHDRPDLKKPRRLVLQLDLLPVNDRGQLMRTDVAFAVKATIPPKASASYPMQPTQEGLEFQPDIPDNPRQNPLPFEKGGAS